MGSNYNEQFSCVADKELNPVIVPHFVMQVEFEILILW
jgi:hypothetical protein